MADPANFPAACPCTAAATATTPPADIPAPYPTEDPEHTRIVQKVTAAAADAFIPPHELALAERVLFARRQFEIGGGFSLPV
jgi:hypothetical protein